MISCGCVESGTSNVKVLHTKSCGKSEEQISGFPSLPEPGVHGNQGSYSDNLLSFDSASPSYWQPLFDSAFSTLK